MKTFLLFGASQHSQTKGILLESYMVVSVFVAAGVGRSGRQEHVVCLGLEERTSPRHGNRTLRQSTTLRSFTLKRIESHGVYPSPCFEDTM